MYTSLPAPSKGALRALRQIALGTSCTIAIGTGLIAEDRRRRIQKARELLQNARRIKESSHYNGAGLGLLAGLENELNHGNSKPLLREGASKLQEHHGASTDILASHERPILSDGSVEIQREKERLARRKLHIANLLLSARQTPTADMGQLSNYQRHLALQHTGSHQLQPRVLKSSIDTSDNEGFLERQNRHHVLVSRLTALLYSTPNFEEAISGSFPLSDEPDKIPSTASTYYTCVKLSRTCVQDGTLESFIPVLKAISVVGCSDQGAFNEMQPELFISALLHPGSTTGRYLSPDSLENLKDATSIFLTKFKNTPEFTPAMREVGVELFEASLEAGLYKRSFSVYYRLSNQQGFVPSVDHIVALIIGRRAGSHHKHALKIFRKFFVNVKPSQAQFDLIVDEVVLSACKLNLVSDAEKVVEMATSMAKTLGLVTKVGLVVRVLDKHWKVTKDLQTSHELFVRLHALCKNKTLYTRMIRFCVLANKLPQAQYYLDYLLDGGKGYLDLETLGYLMAAKAKEGTSWEEVIDSFKILLDRPHDRPSDLSKCLTPIFKAYADSHEVSETEEFICLFLDEFNIRPNQYIFNIMVDVYAEAEEFDSISNWISYMRPHGLGVNSVTFNSIISKHLKKWPARFDGLCGLCERVKAMDESMIDSFTITALRAGAVVASNGDTYQKTLRLRRVDRLSPSPPYGGVVESMTQAIKGSEHFSAVRHYMTALKNGEWMAPSTVALAITSCFLSQSDDKFDLATDLIIESRVRGLNTDDALELWLIAQVKNTRGDPLDVESFITRALAVLKTRGLKVPLNVITTVTNTFIDSHQSRRALDFWFSIKQQSNIADSDIDLVSLTVLLKAFLALSDISGIEWTIKTLCQNSIIPDQRFKRFLTDARKGVAKYVRSSRNTQMAVKLLHVIEESVGVVRAIVAANLEESVSAEGQVLGIIEKAALAKGLGLQSPKRRGSKFPGTKYRSVLTRRGVFESHTHLGEDVGEEVVSAFG